MKTKEQIIEYLNEKRELNEEEFSGLDEELNETISWGYYHAATKLCVELANRQAIIEFIDELLKELD